MRFDPQGFPGFYAEVPALVLRDPLAELLGAARGGLLTYHYVDAVRLAGHSCPTVAGAWGLTRRALSSLYLDVIPRRGDIAVNLAESQHEGVAGVVASVVGLITGAAGTGGFKGLGGQYRRQGLLRFGTEQPLALRFVRQDTGAAVDAVTDLSGIAPDPATGELLREILSGRDDPAMRETFSGLWQERVRRILIDHADDPSVFRVRKVP